MKSRFISRNESITNSKLNSRETSKRDLKSQLRDPFHIGDNESGYSELKLSKEQMESLAYKLGKRLVTNEKFLDDLADALDGIDIKQDLSDTEKEESEFIHGQSSHKTSKVGTIDQSMNKSNIMSPTTEQAKPRSKPSSRRHSIIQEEAAEIIQTGSSGGSRLQRV